MYISYLLTALLVFCATASPIQNSAEWDLFKSTYNKQYADLTEESFRRGIFNENIAKIDLHNEEAARGLHSYTLKMNKFGDMTHEEFVRIMARGLKIGEPTEFSSTFDRHTYLPPSHVTIPAAVDWRKKGAVTTVIEDQGQCGSCWAFTANGALEGQHFLKTGKLVRLSAQNLIDCSTKYGNDGCCGGYMDYAFQYIKDNKGIDTAASYPYEAQDGKCRFTRANVGATDTGFMDIPKGNETALQIAIAAVGPISVAVDATQPSFQFYSSGVYDDPKCSTTDVNHTFIVVGYDTYKNSTAKLEYYIAKNSWGESWGNKGYIWMSRNKHNQCGISNIASYPLV